MSHYPGGYYFCITAWSIVCSYSEHELMQRQIQIVALHLNPISLCIDYQLYSDNHKLLTSLELADDDLMLTAYGWFADVCRVSTADPPNKALSVILSYQYVLQKLLLEKAVAAFRPCLRIQYAGK